MPIYLPSLVLEIEGSATTKIVYEIPMDSHWIPIWTLCYFTGIYGNSHEIPMNSHQECMGFPLVVDPSLEITDAVLAMPTKPKPTASVWNHDHRTTYGFCTYILSLEWQWPEYVMRMASFGTSLQVLLVWTARCWETGLLRGGSRDKSQGPNLLKGPQAPTINSGLLYQIYV